MDLTLQSYAVTHLKTKEFKGSEELYVTEQFLRPIVQFCYCHIVILSSLVQCVLEFIIKRKIVFLSAIRVCLCQAPTNQYGPFVWDFPAIFEIYA